MKKLLRLISLSFVAIFFFLVSASPSLAVQFKTGENLNFPKSEKIDETVFVAGNKITFDSDIIGDLLCAGPIIVINGNVKGDILCAGQDIKINGQVDGNVRVISQSIEIKGSISRNLYAVSQSLTLDKTSSIKGDVFFGAQSIDLSGTAGRDLAGAGESITISGSLLRNAMVNSMNLNISDTAKIRGDLDYYTEKDRAASISSKSIIGQIRRHDYVLEDKTERIKQVESFSFAGLIVKTLFGALAFFIIASALIYFDKARTQKVVNRILEKPFNSMLIGLAVFASFPFVFFILMVTLIGMPAAFLLLLIYIVFMISASVYSSYVIGWKLIQMIKKQTPNSYLSALVGCFALGLVAMIPVIGWLIAVLAFFAGLGSLFVSYLPEKAK